MHECLLLPWPHSALPTSHTGFTSLLLQDDAGHDVWEKRVGNQLELVWVKLMFINLFFLTPFGVH